MASAHTSIKADQGDVALPCAVASAVTTGLMARWDVLQWVPFAGLGIGRYHFSGADPTLQGGRWGIPVKAGVEYLFSRNWIVSAQVSGHVVVRTETTGLDWAQFTVGIGPSWEF